MKTIEPGVAAYTFRKLLRLLHTMQKHGKRTLPVEYDIARANACMMLGMAENAIEIIEDNTPWTIADAEAEIAPQD